MRCMRNRYYGHIDISPMKYSSLMRYKYVIYEEKTKSVISIAELVVQIGRCRTRRDPRRTVLPPIKGLRGRRKRRYY